MQSRYYDPETGRFICADTLLVAGSDLIQGTNLFAYCYNNPIMYSDPSGYEAEKLAAEIVICLSGLIYVYYNLPKEEFDQFIKENVYPNIGDIHTLSESFIKLAKGLGISEYLAYLAESGSNLEDIMGITEFFGVNYGAAGYVYTGIVGILEIASVAFDPFSTGSDVINGVLRVSTGIVGGMLAASLGAALAGYLVSTGGMGAIPAALIGIGVTIAAGAIINYIIDSI